MASAWDTISSAIPLIILLGVIFTLYRLSKTLTSQTSQTVQSLSQKGVTYNQGVLSVKTDKAAPSREEYIASTQRAFESGAREMRLHPDAFRVGGSGSGGEEVVGGSSGIDSEKKGFKPTKKLA